MKWEKVHIADICEIKSGKRIPKGFDFSPITTEYRYIRAKDIKKGKIDCSELGYISKDVKNKIAKYIVQKNDVVISIAGTIGEVGYVPNELDGINLTENAVRLTNFTKSVYSKFVLYWLMTEQSYEYMNSVAAGSAQPKLGIYKIEQIPISLPPLDIQYRIADILSAYDDLIENNRKQIKLLEEAAQRLYKEWFVDLRFPGYEHTKNVDGVPEGWKKSTTAAVSSVLRRGISPYYNEKGKSVVINQKCIRQTVVDFNESRRQEKPYPEEMNLQDSDTVICSTGSGTLGRVGQIFGDCPDATFDSHVTLVRAKEGFGKQYLFQSLKARQTYLMGMGKGSTNQLELSRGTIQDLDIYVPPKKVLDQFEQVAQPIHDKISIISNSIIQLQTARDCLLPKLMSGEMEV